MVDNLDKTQLRLVRKGVTVRADDGRCGLVVKTSRGACLVRYEGQRYANTERCGQLCVIDTGVNRRALTTTQRAQARDLRERIALLEKARYRASADALRAQLRRVLSGADDIDGQGQ